MELYKDFYKDIKTFFKKELPNLKVDRKLIKNLRTFRLNWSTKNDEYIDFLGSKLLGLHTIRFSYLDDEKLMKDTLGIDNWKILQNKIVYRTKEKNRKIVEEYGVRGVEKNFKIASDIIYQTLMYIAHESTLLKDKKLKEEGVREACLIMQYRMISSIYSWYFKYNTTEAIATTVYNKLSHKYLIKQHNNWQEVFEYRVKNCLDPKSPNYKKLHNYNTEDAIRLISDIQTKLREQVKQIYKILIEVKEKNEIIKQESSTFVGGEKNEEQVKDISSSSLNYVINIKKIIFNKNDFINKDMIKVIDKLVPNINESIMLKYLSCVSDIKDEQDQKQIYSYVETIVIKDLEYLQRINLNIEQRENIYKAISLIKNYWSSSKVKDPEMKEIKNYFNKLAFTCTGKKTSWLLVSLAIGIITYIFLMSLKKS